MFGLVFSPVSHAEGDRIAVLELRGPVADDVLSLMTDEVRGGVLDVAGDEFIVMTRENMAMIAQDMGLDFSCVEGACEVETGRNLQAAYVVSGEVVTVGGSMNLILKLHETKKGALRETLRTKSDTVDALMDAARDLARALTHQGLGLPGKPVGAAAVPSGGQAFGGYQGGNFGQDLGIDAQLKEQACDDAAEARGRDIRDQRLADLENKARAAASADWQKMSSQATACEQLKRVKRNPCIEQVERWIAVAQSISVGIKAGTEQVDTECGVRRPAFREQNRIIEASEVSDARRQLRRLQAADRGSSATPQAQGSFVSERSSRTGTRTHRRKPDRSHSSKLKKLDQDEYDHYMALRVYLDRPDARGVRRKDERKAFFKIKTREERDQWLKDKGLWDKFYQYDAHIREKIVQGAVQLGWDKEMVYQAWGRPHVRRKLPGRQVQRSEVFVYRFEVRQDGVHQVWVQGSKDTFKAQRLYTKELIIDDGKVTEMKERDGVW